MAVNFNPENLQLRQLHPHDEAVFNSSLELWAGEDLDWYSFILAKNPFTPFSFMLTELNKEHEGKDLHPDRVPATMLYAFYDDLIIGRLHIRHHLNEALTQRGGHIGYAVAKDWRGQGVATEMFSQGLVYAKDELHLKKLLITCTDSNVPSFKLIERFGGVLENKVYDQEHEETIRRYWILL